MIFLFIFCGIAQELIGTLTQKTLGEGLELYVHSIPKTGFISISFQYLLSQEVEEGLPHLIEHLMFSHHFQEKTYDQYLESIGGKSQGKTDLSSIRLYVEIPKESWKKLLMLEKDRFQNICEMITDEAVERQKKIVEQEYFLYQQHKDIQYGYILRKAIFEGRGLGNSVLGDMVMLEKWNKESLCHEIQNIQNKAAIRIVVVGDIRPEEIQQDAFSFLQTNSRRNQADCFSSPKRFRIVRKKEVGMTSRLYALWTIPARCSHDSSAIHIWKDMLTHPVYGILNKGQIKAQGWVEYGIDEGYFLIRLEGGSPAILEDYLKKTLSRLDGLFSLWKNVLIAKEARRIDIMQKWQTQEERLLWIEDCVSWGRIESCFSSVENISLSLMHKTKKRWLSWDDTSFLHVDSP